MSKTENELRREADALVEKDRQHLWHHLTQHKIFQAQEPMIVVEGKGCMITDQRGNQYLDGLSGGVWCVNVGYGRNSIADVVSEQLSKMPYYALSIGNPPAIELTQKLAQLLPDLQKVYFSSSGSEANEKAFKISRQYFRLKYPDKEKNKIIYRHRDYHGATYGAMSAGGQTERTLGYGPLVPGFVEMPHCCCYRCEFGKTYPGCEIECAAALEEIIQQENPETVAAVILETVVAGGGIIVPVDEYLGIIEKICRKYEVFLILDEVVNGFGRTGKMFGFQHWDVSPDMITTAKGMASGYLPISATMAKQEIFAQFVNEPGETLAYFRDISTFGGCAASCSATLENIRIIEEENLCQNSEKMGRLLLEGLKELESHPMVGEVRGIGLFAGIEIVEDKQTKAPANESLMAKIVGDVKAQGVIIGRMNRSVPGLNNVVTMAPPLIITAAEVERIVKSIGSALANIK
ncbi:MAG: aspartate aminotransferase family protein [Firmicutes bacterium HGW-Firmicutes-14]|nr:MAG: aspartate aminotransferase family protein [Firmicutes bacterium HGW-Firmicutes-14]